MTFRLLGQAEDDVLDVLILVDDLHENRTVREDLQDEAWRLLNHHCSLATVVRYVEVEYLDDRIRMYMLQKME